MGNHLYVHMSSNPSSHLHLCGLQALSHTHTHIHMHTASHKGLQSINVLIAVMSKETEL